jgi:hypothetical protein
MVVARAMLNRAQADDLRQSCMTVALELGGWEKKNRAKAGRFKRAAIRGSRAGV